MRMRYVLITLLALMLAGCYKPESESHELGTEKNPLVMYFVPSTEAEKVLDSAEELIALLNKETGLYFKADNASSYVSIVEAMAVGKVHIGWLPPMAYVFAHQRNGDEVILKVVRRGKVVVMADSGIETIADLKGKRVAFADPASASGHLYPRTLLLENGVDPDSDLADVIFSGGHDTALIALVKGSAEAACSYEDARERLVTAGFTDVMETTRVLAYTPEIPADNVSVIKDLDPVIRQKLTDGLMAISQTERGKQVLMDLYEIDGLVPAANADYDPVRQMAQVLELDIEQEVRKDD